MLRDSKHGGVASARVLRVPQNAPPHIWNDFILFLYL